MGQKCPPFFSRIVLYVLSQATIVAGFFLIDTYAHEVFSTDTRNFAFLMLDSMSKVIQEK